MHLARFDALRPLPPQPAAERDGVLFSAAMRAFAYGGGVHKMQMNRYRELETADRSSFTRAVALETRGSWMGADPLRA